jgi:hypothetical protein
VQHCSEGSWGKWKNVYHYYLRPRAESRAGQRVFSWWLQNLGAWNDVFGKIHINGQFQRHVYFCRLKMCTIWFGVQVSQEPVWEIMKEKLLGCVCLIVTGTRHSALVLKTRAEIWTNSNGNAKKYIFSFWRFNNGFETQYEECPSSLFCTRMHYSAAVSFRTVPNRKQNFTHTLFSLLSAIIKIAEPSSSHLEKKPQ